MERKSKKLDEKKADKPKDRGDKTNLLVKVFEDLDIRDFLPIRDSGDAKANVNRSLRYLNSEKPTTTQKGLTGAKKKTVEFSASEVKSRRPSFVLDSDDSSKKEHHAKYKEEKKKLEDSKAKTTLSIVKDVHKVKAENKPRAYSEQLIKSKPEIERIEEARRIDEKIKRINENAYIGEEARRIERIKNLRLPPGKDLKFIENDALERRKLLRQRYTVKLNNSNKNFESKDSFKIDEYKLKNEASEIFDREKLNESPKDILQLLETTKLAKKPKELTEVQRKPIIKTIRNHDHRVYKAVTFIDQKETTPLQIKMPNSKKSVETNTIKNKLKVIASKESVHRTKEKPIHKNNTKERRSIKRIRKRPASPALTVFQGCPQTEVAKWAPSSITQHTKPYYEAWVDTTLAAITKCSEKDKLKYSKQQIIRTFKRALEMESRPDSPIYEKIHDEKYMGRITVNKVK